MPTDIWSRSFQSNDWNNSCVVSYSSAAGSNLTRDAQVSLLLTDSRSRSSVSQEAFKLPHLHQRTSSTWITLSASQNTDTVGEVGCFHRTPACSVWGVKWYTLSLLVKKLVSVVLDITKVMKEKSWNVYFCALPSGILVHSVHILCGIPVLHVQCCRSIQFRWTTIMIAQISICD